MSAYTSVCAVNFPKPMSQIRICLSGITPSLMLTSPMPCSVVALWSDAKSSARRMALIVARLDAEIGAVLCRLDRVTLVRCTEPLSPAETNVPRPNSQAVPSTIRYENVSPLTAPA